MGFNNGYDSGYFDCEAANRKKWEKEAVERYKADTVVESAPKWPTLISAFSVLADGTLVPDKLVSSDGTTMPLIIFGENLPSQHFRYVSLQYTETISGPPTVGGTIEVNKSEDVTYDVSDIGNGIQMINVEVDGGLDTVVKKLSNGTTVRFHITNDNGVVMKSIALQVQK